VATDAGRSTFTAPAPLHRPTNVSRTVCHVGFGVLAMTFLRTLPTRGWLFGTAAAFATFCWTCEIVRRRSPAVNERLMRFFGPVAHAHEWHRVNSATWYATALLIMAAVVPFHAAEIGVVVLALADPMAGVVGRRYGRRRLASGKSLEGAAAFATTGALAALAWSSVAGTFEGSRVAIAVVGGVVGAVIELLVTRVDDNLAVPLGTSLAVTVAALAI
jgi:dolichol kinase